MEDLWDSGTSVFIHNQAGLGWLEREPAGKLSVNVFLLDFYSSAAL